MAAERIAQTGDYRSLISIFSVSNKNNKKELEVITLANKQEVQQCIDMCTQAANTLRSAANTIPNSASREMATLGASHIEMCIRSCEQAKNLT